MGKQRKLLNEETGKILMVLIAFAVALAVGLILWSCIDFEAATTDDYNYLYEHFEALKSYEMEAFHDMEDVEIHVQYGKLTLESKECSLVFEITDDHTFIEVEKQDNAWLGANRIAPILMLAFACVMAGRAIYEIEEIFTFIGKWCFAKIKLLSKRNRES